MTEQHPNGPDDARRKDDPVTGNDDAPAQETGGSPKQPEDKAVRSGGSGPASGRPGGAEAGEGPGEPAGQSDSASEPAPEANEESMKAAENSQDFDQFRADLEAVERRIAGEIDPGVRAMVVAGAVFVLLLSLVLPHAGEARGFDVLLYDAAAIKEHIGLPSRVFEWFVTVFGIGFSLAALLTRRWVLAWIAVAGTAIASVFGVLSIWHRQTPGLGNYEGAGPGIGLILATIAAMVLTFHWVRVVWSRTAVHLAAEEQRRIAAAQAEEHDHRKLFGEK
ncbi:hypothetical protein Ntsu_26020 [Nocardia sp. IFM 10818]